MHEEEVWFDWKDQKAEVDSGTEHPERSWKHHKAHRGALRRAHRYENPNTGKLALVFELMEMNLY